MGPNPEKSPPILAGRHSQRCGYRNSRLKAGVSLLLHNIRPPCQFSQRAFLLGIPSYPCCTNGRQQIRPQQISQECPDLLVRAYADDTAIVTHNFWQDAPRLQRIFDEFACVSGLHLNMSKSVIIPLSMSTLDQFQKRLSVEVPVWTSMEVNRCGIYLGFTIGPGRQDQSWRKASDKYMARVALWGNEPLGLQYDALV